MQNLEDNYQRTLQDEAKELDQLVSRKNSILARQEEFLQKIRNLGPLSSDAFEMYSILSISLIPSIFFVFCIIVI